jgi:hypothetical protein
MHRGPASIYACIYVCIYVHITLPTNWLAVEFSFFRRNRSRALLPSGPINKAATSKRFIPTTFTPSTDCNTSPTWCVHVYVHSWVAYIYIYIYIYIFGFGQVCEQSFALEYVLSHQLPIVDVDSRSQIQAFFSTLLSYLWGHQAVREMFRRTIKAILLMSAYSG